MGYKLDDKDIKLTNKRMTKIGNGANGDVFKYRNMALKIFRDGKTPIDYYTAEYLSNISTDRILLPQNLLFYNNTFKGYTHKLVIKKGTQRMIMLPKFEFIQNIRMLERDIEILSNKKVLLNGVAPDNTIFNGDLYLIDPTEYRVMDTWGTDVLEDLNKCQLHLLLISLITSELRKNNFSTKVQNDVKELLEMKDSSTDSSDFFTDVINNNDSVKQFVKRMK